jgi:hypothetical protein
MLADDHDEDGAVDEGDRIPLSGESHRGVPLHAGQNPARLRVVKHDIDRAYKLDVAALLDFAVARPTIDLPRIRAASAGIASRRWQNPRLFCSDLDAHDENAAPREQPLDDAE